MSIGTTNTKRSSKLKAWRGSLRALHFLVALTLLAEGSVQAAEPASLRLEAKVLLGDVKGRIDHFAIDLRRQRLFVAELGNNSVGIIDLRTQMLIRTIADLKEPQGLGYVPSTDTLYVSNAGDGSVRLFRGDDFSSEGRIELGDDADNIRVDMQTNRVFVGYGNGALAVIDPASRTKVADISLKAHPESWPEGTAYAPGLFRRIGIPFSPPATEQQDQPGEPHARGFVPRELRMAGLVTFPVTQSQAPAASVTAGVTAPIAGSICPTCKGRLPARLSAAERQRARRARQRERSKPVP